MLKRIRKMKAQSTLEYAVLVVIVVAALLSLQVYVKRGIQGRLRKSADDVGDQFSVVQGSEWNKTVVSTSRTTETNVHGAQRTVQNGDISSNTVSTTQMGQVSQEFR